MASQLLNVSALSAGTEDKPILHSVDLAVGAGECHVLMGPNGAGKSTLGHVIMGDPAYRVTGGRIEFDGADVTELSADKRSLAGIFLSYQAPVEVPGVPLYSFLRTICQKRPELKTTARKFRTRVGEIADQLELDQSFLMRELNVGFSGGEKKKIEMLQLLLLQPKLAILDETDSGLDVDALGIVSRGIQAYREQVSGALIVITHNTRILERLEVDRTHVMVKGRMVAEGPAELIAQIDANGFERFERGDEQGEACAECPGCPKAGDAE
ncbi:Fe-S cluster assembly ATPase SufC [Olsenella sp. An293]|uniref:Fe-S cluster assembly ATPase SufC n=1 Tax=Olsenella sp. An293 TaxID=1965626 RepID=UPI000B3812B1|nr:Fe-S cluster assembly ATPase SufC [Olsenella sp. An293]OUO32378.1 Fe-S cluster assembly ATPase SufC [Olsenella sp. An293]